MIKNPLIKRYGYSLMRPRQFFIYLTIYCVIVALMLLINLAIYRQQQSFGDFLDLANTLYYQFLVLEVLILVVWGACNSNSAINEEIIEKSYDFFKLLPLSAISKATGILIGKNLVVIQLACFNALCVFILGVLAKINFVLQLQTALVILFIALLANSLALLGSINPTKKGKKSAPLILLISFFFMPWLFASIAMMSETKDLESFGVGFYTLKVPLFMLVSVLAMYSFVWAMFGIVRKFNNENEPLFNRFGGILFLVIYEFIVLGLFYSHFGENVSEILAVFWVMSLLPVLKIPLASIRSYENYLERSGRGRGSFLSLFSHSNIVGGLILFVIWLCFVMGGTSLESSDIKYCLVLAADIFSAYLFAILLLELFVVLLPTYSKIGILILFVVGIYLILPMALSGIFDNDSLAFYSPFGLLGGLSSHDGMTLSDQMNVLMVNCALCVVPLAIISKQYFKVVRVRKEM